MVARLSIVGEAPPPERFFYFGDSLFFRFLRKAFEGALPQAEQWDAGYFLAFFRALGGWRIDVCDAPQRATKGGSEDVTDCLEKFEKRWAGQPRHADAVLIVSPKRLVPRLPEKIRADVTASVPPPGQWNAHREAFLRDINDVLIRHIGKQELNETARTVDRDDAALDFEIARACAEGETWEEIRRLLRGHPRETALRTIVDAPLEGG